MMPYPEELERWIAEVSTAFVGLNRAQARVLALYSYGMTMTRYGGQTVISTFLGLLLGLPIGNLRQRLREWTYAAADKRGKQRQAVVVEGQFASLLGWIVRQWHLPQRLVLALDVTYLKDRYTVLAVSVLYRGCAIPVAWHILPGEAKGEWHPLWVAMLHGLRQALPLPGQVLVLCDRGLYSKRLFQVICHHQWHPVMRIRLQGYYRRHNRKRWLPLHHIAKRGMKSQALRVTCFKGDPLVCTLAVHWQAHYDEPCLVVTDLPPRHLDHQPYALRTWIECGFKDLKSDGLRWQHGKMTEPERMSRLLLVMALALFWLIRHGSMLADELLTELPPAKLSCVTFGWIASLVHALHHRPLPAPFFHPYALPPSPS